MSSSKLYHFIWMKVDQQKRENQNATTELRKVEGIKTGSLWKCDI